jgi:CheY-like chemotaxis protein
MATVIFCEDEAIIRKMIAAMLRGSGHEVHFAADGEGGLALVDQVHPAAVFTDRWMPGLDGFALCDALKAQPALAQLPVILISASVAQDEVETAYRHGFAAVLRKPFSPTELRSLVERFTLGE